jgi:AraC family transcriptional regulator
MLTEQKIFIKGMVCDRCITSLTQQLEESGFKVTNVYLGEATIIDAEGTGDLRHIHEKLHSLGFSLIEDKQQKLVKQAKKLVEEVYSGTFDFPEQFRFSALAEKRMNRDYSTISAVFSASEKTTLESYILSYRMNKIKEALLHSDNTLSDLSFRFGFSSVAHLSRQFKAITGLNPSHFKATRSSRLLEAAARLNA